MRRSLTTWGAWSLCAIIVSGCATLPKEEVPVSPLDRGMAYVYADPLSPGARWVRDHSGDPRADLLGKQFGVGRGSGTPTAVSLTIGDPGGIDTTDRVSLAAMQDRPENDPPGSMPWLIVHGEPAEERHTCDRDVDTQAAGAWWRSFSEAIGERPAVVVVMSQAARTVVCRNPRSLSSAATVDRAAVDTLSTNKRTAVVLGVGPIDGFKPTVAHEALKKVGMRDVVGLAVDVGGYATVQQKDAWGGKLQDLLSTGKDDALFAIADIGRVGAGSESPDACNPLSATASTQARRLVEADQPWRLWLTQPGISDGRCGIAPDTPAGEFSPDLAWNLLSYGEGTSKPAPTTP